MNFDQKLVREDSVDSSTNRRRNGDFTARSHRLARTCSKPSPFVIYLAGEISQRTLPGNPGRAQISIKIRMLLKMGETHIRLRNARFSI